MKTLSRSQSSQSVSGWECRFRGSASLAGGRAAIDLHFQEEAGNEI
ncbi:MAG: hypothetical protein V7K98_01615 [Nostoc sp.]